MPDPELRTRMTLPPSAEVSNPQIEAGMNARQHAQDSKIPRFERWNLRNLGWNLGKNRFTSALASCYIEHVASVKRDRAWTPAFTHSATKAAVPATECGFVIRAPFMAARQAGASLAGSRKSVSGSPTCRAAALIGLSAVVVANHTLLEAIMATSFNALKFQDISRTPTTGTTDPINFQVVHGLSLTDPRCAEVLNALPGMADPAPTAARTPDPIQLHADVHNALSMAVFYLRQPQANTAAARRKAIQALTALRGLSLALEG